jgi:exonuclease I
MEGFSMGEVIQFNQNPKNEIFFFTNQGDVLKGLLHCEENNHANIQVKFEKFRIPKGFYFFGKRNFLDHLEQNSDFHAELIKKVVHIM